MRILKLMTLVAMISTIYTVTAQNPKRANIWYFGTNAGLDFTNGNPVAITTGAMQASEGVAIACDITGNLQFYTNGGDLPNTGAIWNRNNQVMPNGYLGHTGCGSSIQSSLIVNLPGSGNFYYLFTTDCYENGLENGLTYSLIDMNLDGGLGDVVEKGIPLTRNTNESLAAALNANGKEYWIITHKANTDSFYVYQLTGNGIVGVVKSKGGPVADETAGEIKVAGNGQRLVFAGTSFAALFDFDASTGIISNYRNLGTSAFTACFSPNCELLYAVNFFSQKIYQFDLLANNISATRTLVGSPSNYLGSIQIGPDDKIYGAIRNSQYLATITRPNIKGVDCNFVENGIYLGGKLSRYGLPNYPNNVLGECLSYPVENVSKYDFFMRLENLGSNSISLSWNDYPGGEEYRISYRKTDGDDWKTLDVASNIFSANDLKENTDYEFRLNSIKFPNGEYDFIYNHNFNEIVSGNQNAISESATALKVKTPDNFSFNVYPVPAGKDVNMEFTLDKISLVDVFITDLSGKEIFQQKLEGQEGVQKLEIPTAQLPNGIYHLLIKSGTITGNKKLIVMN